jgi:hypothetical protein
MEILYTSPLIHLQYSIAVRKERSMVAIASETSLVGTWKLLSRVDVASDGQRRAEPNLGSDPVSYLMYDTSGHFAVQFMRRDRRDSNGGYDAYFGKYSVADGTVTQELEGALSPDNVGKVVMRGFRIDSGELVITLDATTSDGEPVTRTLRWERLA